MDDGCKIFLWKGNTFATNATFLRSYFVARTIRRSSSDIHRVGSAKSLCWLFLCAILLLMMCILGTENRDKRAKEGQ